MRSRAYSFLPLLFAAGLICACATAKRTGLAEAERAPPPPPPTDKIVTAEDIQRSPGASLDQAMSGKFPGVWITRAPDGGLRVRIRGTTSIMANQEPLYVLDGIPLQSGPGGNLTGIVPADIASIEVLKDAIATSMYGIRGANGVILIKTKPPPQN